MSKLKTCRVCQLSRVVTDFRPLRSLRCKDCEAAHRRERYRTDPEYKAHRRETYLRWFQRLRADPKRYRQHRVSAQRRIRERYATDPAFRETISARNAANFQRYIAKPGNRARRSARAHARRVAMSA